MAKNKDIKSNKSAATKPATVKKIGSAQELGETRILSRFLKNDKFCFCDRHALCLEQ